MKLSIGIPTYSRPKELVSVVENILMFGLEDYEIIISDNGGSWSKALQSIIEQHKHIKYFYNENNIGVIKNTLKCLETSKGDFFTWISDDDWRSQEFLSLCCAELENSNDKNIFVCSNVVEVNSDGQKSRPYRQRLSKYWDFYQSKNKFVRVLAYFLTPHMMGKCNLM